MLPEKLNSVSCLSPRELTQNHSHSRGGHRQFVHLVKEMPKSPQVICVIVDFAPRRRRLSPALIFSANV